MGTRSTVKFYEDNVNILSVYQQYDGAIEGVGKQVADLLRKYTVVNGVGHTNQANGISELALFYIVDNKKKNGNIYATNQGDEQEFNYEVRSTWGAVEKDKINVKVFRSDGHVLFDGNANDYIDFVDFD